MTRPPSANERTDHHEQGFSSTWAPIGPDAAEARAAGEVDLVTAAALGETLRAASEHGRLVLLDLGEITFMDASGLHVLTQATGDARRTGRHLVVSRASAWIHRLLALTGAGGLLDVLTAASPRTAAPGPPPANPVNARVSCARVMAVPGDELWLLEEDGAVQRAWLPRAHEALRVPGRPIELFVGAAGDLNGWRDPISGLAVNQRRLDPSSAPATSAPVACQGRCGVVWQAPAASSLPEHGEHCLTCGGPLARG